jgi:hypothetical protein
MKFHTASAQSKQRCSNLGHILQVMFARLQRMEMNASHQ